MARVLAAVSTCLAAMNCHSVSGLAEPYAAASSNSTRRMRELRRERQALASLLGRDGNTVTLPVEIAEGLTAGQIVPMGMSGIAPVWLARVWI
ncbi:hypothetical protein ACNKHX_14265 [Shigella flexneri]